MKYIRVKRPKSDIAIGKIVDIIRPRNMVIMTREIDASAINRLRQLYQSSGRRKPSYTTLIVKTAAMTIEKNSFINRKIFSFFFFSRLYQFKNIDISVTIDRSNPALDQYATTQNLVFRNAERLNLEHIAKKLQAVAKHPKHPTWQDFNRLISSLPAWLSSRLVKWSFFVPTLWLKYCGGACCVNSPARDGADLVLTSWPFPLSFSFGLVHERPIAIDGKVEARPTIPLLMAFDRRIVGGGPASRVFADFIDILQHADTLLTDIKPVHTKASLEQMHK